LYTVKDVGSVVGVVTAVPLSVVFRIVCTVHVAIDDVVDAMTSISNVILLIVASVGSPKAKLK
jgi:hypothetical protein